MKASFLLMFAVCFSARAQQQPLTFTEVVKADSVPAAELYARAKAWFASAYNSANDVIQMDDKSAGSIIGKGSMRYVTKVFTGSDYTPGHVTYKITVQVKDGRYRYEVTHFTHEPLSGKYSFGVITTDEDFPYKFSTSTLKSWRNKVWKDLKDTVNENVPLLIASLKKAMQTQSVKSDW